MGPSAASGSGVRILNGPSGYASGAAVSMTDQEKGPGDNHSALLFVGSLVLSSSGPYRQPERSWLALHGLEDWGISAPVESVP